MTVTPNTSQISKQKKKWLQALSSVFAEHALLGTKNASSSSRKFYLMSPKKIPLPPGAMVFGTKDELDPGPFHHKLPALLFRPSACKVGTRGAPDPQSPRRKPLAPNSFSLLSPLFVHHPWLCLAQGHTQPDLSGIHCKCLCPLLGSLFMACQTWGRLARLWVLQSGWLKVGGRQGRGQEGSGGKRSAAPLRCHRRVAGKQLVPTPFRRAPLATRNTMHNNQARAWSRATRRGQLGGAGGRTHPTGVGHSLACPGVPTAWVPGHPQ